MENSSSISLCRKKLKINIFSRFFWATCFDDTVFMAVWDHCRKVIHDIVDNPFFEWTILLLIFASRYYFTDLNRNSKFFRNFESLLPFFVSLVKSSNEFFMWIKVKFDNKKLVWSSCHHCMKARKSIKVLIKGLNFAQLTLIVLHRARKYELKLK